MAEFKTKEEAILAAHAEIGQDGGTVTVHSKWCGYDDDDQPCICRPEVIIVRAGERPQ